MAKNLKMLKIDLICRKIVDLTGRNCNRVAGMLLRANSDAVQEFHGIINNLEEQIRRLKK